MLTLIVVSHLVLAAEPQGLAPFSAERSWELQRLGAPTISPDGRSAVVAVTRFDVTENKKYADLWLYATDGRGEKRLTGHGSSDGSPVFSPDGRRLAFVSQRDDDKAPQLYVLPLDGGEAQRLTTLPGGAGQPQWFPDGRRIAFVSRVWADLELDKQQKRAKEREESKVKAIVWDGTSAAAWDTLLDDRQLQLLAVPADGGPVEGITLGTGLALPRQDVELNTPLYDLAPDGREVAFVADANPAANDTNNDVWVLTIGQKQALDLTADNLAGDGSPRYSPDGRWLAFTRQATKGFYGDTRRLALFDRKTRKVAVVTEGWDRSADGLVWAPDSQRLFGAIDDAGTVRIHELSLAGKARPVTRSSSYSGLAVSKQGAPVMVALRQSFTEPPTLVRVDPRSGDTVKLSSVNDQVLAGTAFGRVESVTYAGAKGDPIQMWVSYPPAFDPAKKHPVFMLIHGGPHNGITDGMQFRWNAQVFSSWGYVTAWPNFHGSSGFGRAFTDSINPQWDELPYEDVIRAAQWLARQPGIDADRMAAGGGSYGGYLTEILLGREHPFKALVAHAGVYDLYTQVGSDHGFEKPRFGGHWEPSQDAVFRKASPHFGAGRFNTPTLVVHGQRDLRVPVNHGFELYHTLVVRGVPTRMVYFPDENHWVLKPQNSLLWYAEVKRWLELYDVAPAAKPVVASP